MIKAKTAIITAGIVFIALIALFPFIKGMVIRYKLAQITTQLIKQTSSSSFQITSFDTQADYAQSYFMGILTWKQPKSQEVFFRLAIAGQVHHGFHQVAQAFDQIQLRMYWLPNYGETTLDNHLLDEALLQTQGLLLGNCRISPAQHSYALNCTGQSINTDLAAPLQLKISASNLEAILPKHSGRFSVSANLPEINISALPLAELKINQLHIEQKGYITVSAATQKHTSDLNWHPFTITQNDFLLTLQNLRFKSLFRPGAPTILQDLNSHMVIQAPIHNISLRSDLSINKASGMPLNIRRVTGSVQLDNIDKKAWSELQHVLTTQNTDALFDPQQREMLWQNLQPNLDAFVPANPSAQIQINLHTQSQYAQLKTRFTVQQAVGLPWDERIKIEGQLEIAAQLLQGLLKEHYALQKFRGIASGSNGPASSASASQMAEAKINQLLSNKLLELTVNQYYQLRFTLIDGITQVNDQQIASLLTLLSNSQPLPSSMPLPSSDPPYNP